MKTIDRFLIFLFFICFVGGCANIMHLSSPDEKPPAALSEKTFRQKALAQENQGNLREALLAWQIAAKIKDNKRTRQVIDSLRQTIAAEAELHFKSGLSYYQAGKFSEARDAFLRTIRVQPGHKGARYYLKKRLHMPRQNAYKVHRGDSYSKIAARIYGDPRQAYLIAYFNDHDPRKPLLTGTTLLLPVLDPKSPPFGSDISTWITKAQKALNQKKYDQALAYAGKIARVRPHHPEALQITDKAHFAKAEVFYAKRQYLAALKQLKQVRPSYKGRRQAIAKARRHLLKQALKEKFQSAEELLANQEYDSTMELTEEILSQYPDNKRAKTLHNEARYRLAKQLLDGNEHALAAELLENADPTYKDTAQLLSTARSRVRSKAEKHYRKGVNHFINEDLESAIREWRTALQFNPKHPKAQQDIENAMRLLHKYKNLDTKP